MSDRYLFKAKRTDNGKWVEGYLVKYPSGRCEIHKNCIEPPDILIIFEVDSSTICQYTGLTDKNGKKIWENDVVRQLADCDELGNNLYFFYQIRWSEERCAFKAFEIYTEEVVFPNLVEIEVIGNPFDNPELMK